jgi:hypothetical protein
VCVPWHTARVIWQRARVVLRDRCTTQRAHALHRLLLQQLQCAGHRQHMPARGGVAREHAHLLPRQRLQRHRARRGAVRAHSRRHAALPRTHVGGCSGEEGGPGAADVQAVHDPCAAADEERHRQDRASAGGLRARKTRRTHQDQGCTQTARLSEAQSRDILRKVVLPTLTYTAMTVNSYRSTDLSAVRDVLPKKC